ncbi:TolC family protein [Paracnuella aquatica]|uniref:TolC family protein n=1 Tax=Paracnuella aquatica TaxID=2268757 RepID=UPI000DEEABB2|nr:TolC family protein [Paracnuella aquatica]RPD44416.1 TolC family protein [Paracnuella aquatica]
MKQPILTMLLLGAMCCHAQQADTIRVSLTEVVAMAKERSIASRQAQTVKETRYWQYRTFRSNYAPQLSLQGNAPGYNKQFIPVVQPNGTIDFQPVHNNNSSLNLSFSQSLAATGGTVFGTTQIQRFDDFDRKNTLYNGVPYGLGYSQPLFKFNALKWDQRIEPLKYNESKQQFIESMEEIALSASTLFFDQLLAQVNLQIAETNFTNTKNIMRIAAEKYEMGKISRNEILQLQLEELKAQKAVGTARRDIEIANLNLKAFAGMQGDAKIELLVPEAISMIRIAHEKVLSEAYANRSDAIAFMRRELEASRDVAKAKGDNGINATLTARLGYSKSATSFTKMYQSPKDQQLLQLEFDIPILDWGRSKSRTKTAEANRKFTEYAVEQDKQNFAQEIVTEVTLFDMMKDQVALARRADSIASEKYTIAKDRYVLGNLSITDLSIAFQEKDQAKRDYVFALRDYWKAFYRLRYLSLYDFENEQKIAYK